jgi:hypothetical protein
MCSKCDELQVLHVHLASLWGSYSVKTFQLATGLPKLRVLRILCTLGEYAMYIDAVTDIVDRLLRQNRKVRRAQASWTDPTPPECGDGVTMYVCLE